MHFSGTSCLAEALIHAGVNFGGHLRPGNAYPTFEDNRIARLHTKLVQWDKPRVFISTVQAAAERDGIVSSYEGESFGFKEPSALFFTDFWGHIGPVRYVGTFRHPSLVIAHIKKIVRHTQTPPDALWQLYARRLLDLQRQHGFPLVCFDDDEETYRTSLSKAVEYISGPHAKPHFDFDRRHGYPPAPVSAEALALYDDLRAAVA